MKSILINVKNDPLSWGMRCYEAHNFCCGAPRTAQEKQTDIDLSRIGETLFAFGKFGTIINKSLHIDGAKFKTQKILKGKIIIDRLQDLGFVINDNNNEFIIEYPDNQSVLQVIKAYSMLNIDNKDPQRNLIMKAEWLPFGESQGNRNAIVDYCQSLDNEQAEIVKAIYNLALKYDYDVIIGNLVFELKHKDDAKRLGGIKKERDDLSYGFRLDNISNYLDVCDAAPEHIREKIFNGYTLDYKCCGRKKCVGPITYMRDGNNYGKCRMSGPGFSFVNISKIDIKAVLKLLECEIRTRLSNIH
jgi:hypothetical protein